jgi:hypothetical protein
MEAIIIFSGLGFLFILFAPLIAIYNWRNTKADILLAWCFSISVLLFFFCLSIYNTDFNVVINIKSSDRTTTGPPHNCEPAAASG